MPASDEKPKPDWATRTYKGHKKTAYPVIVLPPDKDPELRELGQQLARLREKSETLRMRGQPVPPEVFQEQRAITDRIWALRRAGR